jgi:hypothetical protein
MLVKEHLLIKTVEVAVILSGIPEVIRKNPDRLPP